MHAKIGHDLFLFVHYTGAAEVTGGCRASWLLERSLDAPASDRLLKQRLRNKQHDLTCSSTHLLKQIKILQIQRGAAENDLQPVSLRGYAPSCGIAQSKCSTIRK